ncbi:PEP/pyruvate-binding domain-containing protein [Desulfurobacterium sp.]|uniref:PEP/pyruvate-binding domain-containing protein n=1 Tax=Desulfurobacterium sp. TaxID=2004706 RepID=UPI0026115333|nr:PEP/pyruvate-binding domain-containing protein [Desulfurobacterium sp.]
MEGIRSLNTNVKTPAGDFHVQTEFYHTSQRIITLLFYAGQAVIRIEDLPNLESADLDDEIKRVHESIVRRLSLIRVPVSMERVEELLTLRTGLKNVAFIEEIVSIKRADEIFDFGILVASGAPVPAGIVVFPGASEEEIERGFYLLKEKSGAERFIAKTGKKEGRVTFFNIGSLGKLKRAVLQIIEEMEDTAIVSEMIDARSSGFLYSSDPLTGDNTVIIESSWGICGYIKGNKLNLDKYRVDRETFEFWRIKKEIVRKYTELSIDSETGNITEAEISDDRALMASLSDEEVLTLAKFALSVEKNFSRAIRLDFVISRGGDSYFTDVCAVGIKEKKELLRKISVLEEVPFYPTGVKVFAEATDVDVARTLSFLPCDGIFFNIGGVNREIFEKVLLETAETAFPKPVIVNVEEEAVLKTVKEARNKGFTNVWTASSPSVKIPPDVPSFCKEETPFVTGSVFKGNYGKLFVSGDTLLSPNLSLIRELIRSGFDFIAVHPDEIAYIKKVVASEEKRLMLKMARRFLKLEERI